MCVRASVRKSGWVGEGEGEREREKGGGEEGEYELLV